MAPTWLHEYKPAWLRPDLPAGLTVWAVPVPESLAYATIAGVPPVSGRFGRRRSRLMLYAILGSSRHLLAGPMAATMLAASP